MRGTSCATTGCLEDCQLRLAHQRTEMAFERTFAAWIRTGLAALAFGMAIHGLNDGEPAWLSRLAETGLILLAASCFVTALVRLRVFAGTTPAHRPVGRHLLAAMNWMLLGASMTALILIWWA